MYVFGDVFKWLACFVVVVNIVYALFRESASEDCRLEEPVPRPPCGHTYALSAFVSQYRAYACKLAAAAAMFEVVRYEVQAHHTYGGRIIRS
jgi:hypothetical protein